jgi:acetoin utilization protein AcuC
MPQTLPDPRERPLFIGSEIYRGSSYGSRHPLAIPRVSSVIDLCRALGWLPEEAYLDSPRATPEELARFHDPDYVAAVLKVEAAQEADAFQRQRYNLGVNGNPVYPEVFRRPATAAGASVLAGKLLAKGGIVHSPASGTHHALRDRASGFCYFNDPVLAILSLLDQGVERVFYLDVDAHHGDGVQIAFEKEPRAFTLSVHEEGRWPMRGDAALGGLSDRGGGQARNLPVPPGFNDSELDFLMEAAVLPLIGEFEPEAIVLQCGCDGLSDDPLSRLELSNLALWRVVRQVRGLAPRLFVTGGGGYNPWSVARCWSGVWAVLNSFEIPERLPAEAQGLLRGLSWRHSKGRNPPDAWFTTLADSPRAGPVRPEVRRLAPRVLAA